MKGDGRSRWRTACVTLAAGSAAAWFVAIAAERATAPWLVAKAVAVPLLAVSVALSRRRAADSVWVVVALAVHGAGDLLLEVELLAGMLAFLVGHCLYITAFWRQRRSLDEIGGGTKVGAGLPALAAALVLIYLAPRLTARLSWAVPLYVAALVAMSGAAWWTRPGRPWVPLGATLFVLSDALLGLELFAGGVPGGRQLVWPLYFAGQASIAWGWGGAGRSEVSDEHGSSVG